MGLQHLENLLGIPFREAEFYFCNRQPSIFQVHTLDWSFHFLVWKPSSWYFGLVRDSGYPISFFGLGPLFLVCWEG